MKRIIIPALIVFLIAILMWPIKLIGSSDYTHSTKEKSLIPSETLNENYIMKGSFVPSGSNLQKIGFYIRTNNKKSGEIICNIYSSNNDLVFTGSKKISELKNNAYNYFETNQKFNSSEIYTYEIYGTGCEEECPMVMLTDADAQITEHISTSINGIPQTKGAAISLVYKDSLSSKSVIPYWITLFTIGSLILLAIKTDKKAKLLKTFFVSLFILLITILSINAASEESMPVTQTGATLSAKNASREYNSYIATDSSYDYYGDFCFTNDWSINKGDYTIGIEYTADQPGNKVDVYNNNSLVESFELPFDARYCEFDYTANKDVEDFQIRVFFNGSGTMTVSSIELTPKKAFSSDAGYYCFLAISIFLLCWVIALLNMKTGKKIKNLHIHAALVLLSVFAFLPYCFGYIQQMDDLAYHLVRIEGIKDGLRSGQFPVVIYPEGLSGLGYLNCMYPNLFLYIPAILRLFGVSISTSYKTLVFLSHLATAYIAWFSVKAIMTNMSEKAKEHANSAGLLAAVTYTLCPYRLTNFYARGAVGEGLAMTFFPLLIAGLFLVLQADTNVAKKSVWMIVIGISGILQCHILSSLFAIIICVVYGVLTFYRIIFEKRFWLILRAALWTLLLNIWFIIPFIYFYKKGNLATGSLDWANFTEYSLNLAGLGGTLNLDTYRTLTLGVAILMCAAVAIIVLFEKPVHFEFILGMTIAGGISTLLVSNLFSGWTMMEIKAFDWFLSNVQFAWRFLALASVFLVIAGSVALFNSTNLEKYAPAIMLCIIGISLLSASYFTKSNFAYENAAPVGSTSIAHNYKLIGIPKSDATIVYPYEWRPDGLSLGTEVSLAPDSTISINNYTRIGVTSSFTAVCGRDNEYIDLPITYYDGYVATDELGNKYSVTFSDDMHVRITLNPDDTVHTYTVKYKGLWFFSVACWISIISSIGAIIILIKKRN